MAHEACEQRKQGTEVWGGEILNPQFLGRVESVNGWEWEDFDNFIIHITYKTLYNILWDSSLRFDSNIYFVQHSNIAILHFSRYCYFERSKKVSLYSFLCSTLELAMEFPWESTSHFGHGFPFILSHHLHLNL